MNKFLDSFSIGQRLLDAPVPALIESLAKSIAKAQYEMDATGVQIGALLGETKVPLKGDDGKVAERSLLELGFSPTFYHFQEVELEVKMTISLEVEAGGQLDMTEGAKSIIPMGSPFSLDVHGRFGFEQEGSSRVTAKLVSVPSPATFTDALRRHAGASAKDSAEVESEEPAEPEEQEEAGVEEEEESN